jgi:hypothetical protein
MDEQEYIESILSQLNSIEVERHERGDCTKDGKTDIRSLFDEEVDKARERFGAFKNTLA